MNRQLSYAEKHAVPVHRPPKRIVLHKTHVCIGVANMRLSSAGQLNLQTPWFETYKREFLRTLTFSEHETFDYPVACRPSAWLSSRMQYTLPNQAWESALTALSC